MNNLKTALTLVAVLAASLFFVSPSTAAAQDLGAFDLTVEQTAELGAIQTERHWSIGLYVGATTLAAGGAVSTVLAFMSSLMNVQGVSAEAWLYSSLAASGLGLLMFIPAIALDVHSGIRRNRLRRDVGLSFSVRPTPGGAAVGAELRF